MTQPLSTDDPGNWSNVDQPASEPYRVRITTGSGVVEGHPPSVVAIHGQQSRVEELKIRGILIQGLASYIFATLFLITAALLIVFSPKGRETLTAIVASGLIIIALGSYGYGTFSFRTIGLRIEAGQGSAPAENKPRRRWRFSS